MAGSEKDFGGVVQGIADALKVGMQTGFTTPKKQASLEQAAEKEEAPGRAIPEPKIRATPKQFGKFSRRK